MEVRKAIIVSVPTTHAREKDQAARRNVADKWPFKGNKKWIRISNLLSWQIPLSRWMAVSC